MEKQNEPSAEAMEEARAIIAEWKQDVRNGVPVDADDMLAYLITERIQAAEERGRALEREECAALAEDADIPEQSDGWHRFDDGFALKENIASAIRARAQGERP